MISFFRKILQNKRGNALVIAGAALPLIMGSAGLASDTIQWTLWKRQLQKLADSGAIAGVYAKSAGKSLGSCASIDTATYTDPVAYDIRKNNAIGTTPTCTVTATTWPNTTNAVNVALTMQRELSFSGMFLSAAPTIQANATAATVQTGVYCVVSLENTSATGITATGNSTLDLGCGMITDSTSTNAAIATGSSEVHATPIAAVGDIQESDHWNGADLLPFTVAQADPFAGVNVPTYTGCQTGGDTIAPGPHDTVDRHTDTGVRCLKDFNANGTVLLGSATYIIDSGNFSAGSQANISCTGCTIVLTNSNSSLTASIGTISNINAGAVLNMSAPADSTNPMNGILFYQDRRATSGTASINGHSGSTFTGALYFPSQTLDINGTSNLVFTCAQFVARVVNFSGNGSITNTCTAGYGDNVIMGKHVRLVA